MTGQINIEGKSGEIIGTNRGWTKVMFEDGSTCSYRAKDIRAAKATGKPKAKAKANGSGEVKNDSSTRKIGNAVAHIEDWNRHLSKSGNVSYDNGDKVAEELRDLDLDGVYRHVARALKETLEAPSISAAEEQLRKRYKKLNAGMQRMNLGNRYRAFLRAQS